MLSITPLTAHATQPSSGPTTPATSTATSPENPNTADPLNSPRWDELRRAWLGDAPAEFDSRVQVQAPAMAEDALNVPVRVDASRLRGQRVEEILILADFNPIVRALSYSPGSAEPVLGFRLKLQQSSPVRAAVRTADGRWHVGGTWVATTGGGCTLPSTGSASPEWQRQLNHTEVRAWPRVDGGQRLKLRIVHPMDTGLADGIPAFHLEEISLLGKEAPTGAALAVLRPYEPVAENPVFTLDLPAGVVASGVSGRDNNGNRLTAELRP
ncbi:quinoprotein dehydrogenase-associated SoxYZ-like carrier [Azoarcus indigens]|uniref:Sulfur-oxidizing protein SoxY n=1 Tax=Azoarcus indigens TaxID=29545 RepID=A0A4R6DSD4_9RHOO|nr:quinoprotein dehydrogenase-associated SoxYZ-like carrier [Azoarcus indigens]NMG67384.1 quinoprotein dehydrogenase-associated SoxYZ-like carrier [Azoarcus indigens]TDN47514.1 sulfur-oxidizing protein SoxY [Azoarcus indigens]